MLIKKLKYNYIIFLQLICFFVLVKSNLSYAKYEKQILDYQIIDNGIIYYKEQINLENAKQLVYVLEFDLNNSNFELESVFGNDCLYKKETVSSMAKRKNAIFAINGAFFTKTGSPVGMIVHQGRIIKEPIFGRTVFGITNDNQVFFDNPEFDAYFFFKKANSQQFESIKIDGINRTPKIGEIIVFTSEYGNKTRTTTSNSLEIIVINEQVVDIRTNNSIIPPDGYVIYVGELLTDHFKNIAIGYDAHMELYVNTVWEKAKFAVGGGPRLLTNNKITIEAKNEKFKSDVTNGRAPRTAIGVKNNGKVVMLCVDGRQKSSVGMTLYELAYYMKSIDVKDAMNLDGGGSTTFYLMGKVLNSPSDGRERPVSQAIIIKPKDIGSNFTAILQNDVTKNNIR